MAIYVLVHGAFGRCWPFHEIQAEDDMEQSDPDGLAELLMHWPD